MDMNISQIDWSLVSGVANIIFPLILFFQWHKDRSREAAAKNGLFAVRRMVGRMSDSGAPDVLDALDANLATLGVRPTFLEWASEVKKEIRDRLKSSQEAPLATVEVKTLGLLSRASSSRKKNEIRES
jgi:hypothetical protein